MPSLRTRVVNDSLIRNNLAARTVLHVLTQVTTITMTSETIIHPRVTTDTWVETSGQSSVVRHRGTYAWGRISQTKDVCQ